MDETNQTTPRLIITNDSTTRSETFHAGPGTSTGASRTDFLWRMRKFIIAGKRHKTGPSNRLLNPVGTGAATVVTHLILIMMKDHLFALGIPTNESSASILPKSVLDLGKRTVKLAELPS